MAPLGETARGLKFDSTLMTARTRLGSTLWREAAASMKASTSAALALRDFIADKVASSGWIEDDGSATDADGCASLPEDATVGGAAPSLRTATPDMPRYWLTSAAA